ncbi:MAG: helix-turn-helix domain-containing protein [Huintestinicola sp.]|uniref:helix-turn-helix domain-containing protein n=1 Tax=Huintestinicola sp. TaxID=2981661 RepID=UPI003F04DA21
MIKYMNENYRISHNKEKYTDPIYFHSHDFYEIYFFVDGNVKYYIENESYALSKGDVLIIPPGKLHRPVIDGDQVYERYVLWISSRYASTNRGIACFTNEIIQMTEEKNTRLTSFEGDELRALTGLFDKLLESYVSSDPLAVFTAGSCITLISEAILRKLKTAPRAAEEQEDLIRQVISYINRNVVNAPSLEELSVRFFVSKYYLSHKFKEHTKTTVHQYILMKKVNLAKELLEKGISPQEVCESCGFSTYSNFYKAFSAQTGSSPKQFRRQIK